MLEKLELASFPIREDLQCTRIEANFNSQSGQKTTFVPDHATREPSAEAVSQPDVYSHAKELAAGLGIQRIVDVGCSDGDKLASWFSGDFDVHGINLPQKLPESYSENPKFHACNIALHDSVARCFSRFRDDIPTLFIMAGVLEHLLDPRPILRKVRQLLRIHSSNRLVVSTPDRARINSDTFSVSSKQARIREWELSELVSFLASAGFSVDSQAFTRCNNQDSLRRTCYLECSCSKESYALFLERHGLPPLSSVLVITSEHADASKQGGIGVFVKSLERLLADLQPIVLLIRQDWKSYSVKRPKKEWLLPETFVGSAEYSNTGDMILDALHQIVFFYDSLRIVETQDYMGDSYRIAQAKRSGVLPSELTIKITCHGSACHLENAHEYWAAVSDFPVLFRERELLELADVVSFPSVFLRDLYTDRGYRISDALVEVRPNPVFFNTFDLNEDYRQADTLLFFGRRQTGKGYPDVVQLLWRITRNILTGEPWNGVSRIIFLGEKVPGHPEEEALLDRMGDRFAILEYHLDHSDAMSLLRKENSRSVALLPYKADNAPYCVYECIDNLFAFVAYNTGGISEMVSEGFAKQILCDPNSAAFEEALARMLMLTGDARLSLVKRLKATTVDICGDTNSSLKSAYRSGWALPSSVSISQGLGLESSASIRLSSKSNEDDSLTKSGNSLPDESYQTGVVTIIVPVYNTPLNYIADLCEGINNQTIIPAEVIFVNDGSSDGYLPELRLVVEKCLLVRYRIISQENQGLPAARNAGLSEVTTKYFIAHDSDNILKPDFIWHAVEFLERHPTCAAVTTYREDFKDGEAFDQCDSNRHCFRPQFQSLTIGLIENIFGDALACYRTDTLRSIGGWDSSDRHKWEDWALFLKLTGCGHRLGIINSCLFLYRLRSDSMNMSYPDYPARCRLARNVVGWSRFEAFSLMRLALDNVHLQAETSRLQAETSRLKNSETYIIASRLRDWLDYVPTFKLLLKHSITRTVRLVKHLSR